jgi:hypothetical protein
MAHKHVNNTQAIARQLLGKRVPTAINKALFDYNNENGVSYAIRAEML